jgi:hypothetical protein
MHAVPVLRCRLMFNNALKFNEADAVILPYTRGVQDHAEKLLEMARCIRVPMHVCVHVLCGWLWWAHPPPSKSPPPPPHTLTLTLTHTHTHKHPHPAMWPFHREGKVDFRVAADSSRKKTAQQRKEEKARVKAERSAARAEERCVYFSGRVGLFVGEDSRQSGWKRGGLSGVCVYYVVWRVEAEQSWWQGQRSSTCLGGGGG